MPLRRSLRVGLALAFATATLLLSSATFAARAIAMPGHRAPAFVVERPTGGDMSLANFAGRPLLINVFAAWCANCRIEEPRLVAAYAKYRDRVTFLGIDEQEGVARASAFARELHVPYAIALDAGQFAATYDTSKIPETILIDGHGYVRSVYRGLISSAELDRTLAQLVARKE